MFKHTGAFSTFSVDDVPRAKQFYADDLGLSVSEEMGGLRLHLPDGVEVFVYPKPDHKPANFTVLTSSSTTSTLPSKNLQTQA